MREPSLACTLTAGSATIGARTWIRFSMATLSLTGWPTGPIGSRGPDPIGTPWSPTSAGLYLWVLEQNTAAQAFYRAQGGSCVERELAGPFPGGGYAFSFRYAWPDLPQAARAGLAQPRVGRNRVALVRHQDRCGPRRRRRGTASMWPIPPARHDQLALIRCWRRMTGCGSARTAAMRLPWQARTYERTCSDCGATWRVPRQFVRRHVQGISAFNVGEMSRRPIIRGHPGDAVDWTELNTEVQASMAVGQQSAAFDVCPKCGSDSYTQRPIRS